MREWQVEYMSRPDETEHVEPCKDFKEACLLARRMSDKHDGSAVVVALDDLPDQEGKTCTGHVEFWCGTVSEKIGVLAEVDIP